MHPENQISRNPPKHLDETWFHPGLIWKEWHQQRFLFLLFFLLMMLELIFSLFCSQILVSAQQTHVNSVINPLLAVKTILQSGMSFTETVSGFAVVMLAVIMLGGERKQSLPYLASTAVSRRQILAAKWLLGSLVILLAMTALLLCMWLISALDPLTIPVQSLLLWGLHMTMALLGLFSVAMLSACIFSSILYAAVFSGFFLLLPMLLIHIVMAPLTKYDALSALQAAQVYALSNAFNVISYIGAEGGSGASTTWLPWFSTIILLFMMVLCIVLSLRIFEGAPLERNGEALLIGHSKEIGRLVLACLFAPFYAVNLAESWPWYFVITFLLASTIYFGFGLLWRLQSSLGLDRNAVR